MEATGVVDSKSARSPCFGVADQPKEGDQLPRFHEGLDEPTLRMSGWTCQGDTLPARRAAVGCMLNRLTLLSAGNEPKLAEIFARAELRRGGCGPAASRRAG